MTETSPHLEDHLGNAQNLICASYTSQSDKRAILYAVQSIAESLIVIARAAVKQ
jgi:hypothetical protein